MAVIGNAFLALWHDIEASSQTEYMEWHTREHMPERLSIPGFLVGKRLINHALDRYRYATIYDGSDVEVFRSPAYLDRLNNPSSWSLAIQPAFRNFLRVACVRLFSVGVGDGGSMATVRLNFVPGGNERDLRDGAELLANQLLAVTGVCSVHIGMARKEISDVRTRETELRPEMKEEAFDAIVLIEGSGLPEIGAVVSQIESTIIKSHCGIGEPRTHVYNLAYQLASSEMNNQS